jgi:hypothetical protein
LHGFAVLEHRDVLGRPSHPGRSPNGSSRPTPPRTEQKYVEPSIILPTAPPPALPAKACPKGLCGNAVFADSAWGLVLHELEPRGKYTDINHCHVAKRSD